MEGLDSTAANMTDLPKERMTQIIRTEGKTERGIINYLCCKF